MYSCIWENIPNKTLDSIVITKINAEKWLCVYVYIHLYIYMILLSKGNLFEITGLTFHFEIKGKSKHRLFDKHSKQCHGQTKEGRGFFS